MLRQTMFHGQLNQRADTLSYGERRLLDLLISLAAQPAILLLDEPTAGLSQAESADAMALIRQFAAHSTRVLVSHDLGLIFDACDRIAVLNLGQLVAIDTPQAIRRHEGAQHAYLGGALQ